MSSNTDLNREDAVLSEANKHKKKIAKFKDLLLKELMALPTDNFVVFVEEFVKIVEKSTDWALTLMGITQRNLKTPTQLKDISDICFLKTAVFLVFFEGVYLSYINAICLLLIKNGHDLYNTFTKEYCIDLKDIEELDSCTKLEFVKIHGFGLVVRNDDRRLRNKIAHLNYTIIDEDRIKIDRNNVNIHKRSFDLFTFVMALGSSTSEALKLVSQTEKYSMH